MHGGIPGHESSEASWDAQADLEYAGIATLSTILIMDDYSKFVESLDHQLVRGCLHMLHLPEARVEIIFNMYSGVMRQIKTGIGYGDSSAPTMVWAKETLQPCFQLRPSSLANYT